MTRSPLLLIYLGFPLLLLGLNLHLINLPEYLFAWDERFHALVAKNLLSDPSITRLYPPDFEHLDSKPLPWIQDPIWLHKPPLFSYVEAAFMKVFGTGVFQFRLASAFSVLLLYFSFLRIQVLNGGKPLSAALIALGICINPLMLKLMMGWQGMEHNDLAFITYISLAFWAIMKYQKKGGFGNLLLISLAVSGAILTKWLSGLLPFLFWFLADKKPWRWELLKNKLLAVLLSFITVAPWQIYIHLRFLERAKAATAYNSRHFLEVLEEHAQPWYFHFEQWASHYFLLLGLILALILIRRKNFRLAQNPQQLAAIASIAFVFLFFTIAQTKLPAFTFIILPLVAVLIGQWSSGLGKGLQQKVSLGFLILALAQMSYLPWIDFAELYPEDQHRFEFYQKIEAELEQKSVIIGINDIHQVEAMFYTEHLILDGALEQWYLDYFKKQDLPVYRLHYDSQGREASISPLKLD